MDDEEDEVEDEETDAVAAEEEAVADPLSQVMTGVGTPSARQSIKTL